MRPGIGFLSLVIGLPACAVASWCQLAPAPGEPPVSTAPALPARGRPVAISQQNVNAVDLFFTVRDSQGGLVFHLKEQNCSVLDDKAPQTLNNFVSETNQPLNLGILLDASASQFSWLAMEQDAAADFIRQVVRSRDQAFLLSFDVNLDLLQDYTNSSDLLMRALNKAQINGGGNNDDRLIPVRTPRVESRPRIDPGPVPIRNPRGTLLYDAISLAANEKMNQQTGRKALIVVTDSGDQGSSSTSQEAVAAAEKNNIPVYVVWVGSQDCMTDYRRDTPRRRQRFLDDSHVECARRDHRAPCPGDYVAACISAHTGGRMIEAQNHKQLVQAFQQIQDELRSQYVTSFTPTKPTADGRFHRIEVQCHGDDEQELKVLVRQGYYAPSAGSKTSP